MLPQGLKDLTMKSSDEEDLKKALSYAYKLLAIRDRSSMELIERLIKKGFQRDVAEETLSRLQDAGYINDNRLAENLIRHAIEQKHYGRNVIKTYLRSRGIDDSIIQGIAIKREDCLTSALRFIEKKTKAMKDMDADERAKRLSLMLQRRGHDFDTIGEALK